jgi:hypothetical protein
MPSRENEETATKFSRPIRIVVTAALIAAAIFAPVPFPFKVPLFAALALVIVWLECRTLSPVGLQTSVRPGPTMLWTVVAVLGVIFLLGELINPLIEMVFGTEADHSGYGALEGNEKAALKLFLYALFSAAIAEEIVYRGFLLHQLSKALPEGKLYTWVAILIGAIAFALPHYAQGMVGLISVALVGAFFGWIFFRSGRNLWSLILAHAIVDAWGIYHLYRGW